MEDSGTSGGRPAATWIRISRMEYTPPRRWPMKRKVLLLLLTAVVAFATPAFAQTYELLFAFTGFDYQDPNFSGTYLDLGEGYKLVGFVTQFGPLLTPWTDPSTYEYTNHIFNLTVNARFFTSPNLTVTFADSGRTRYYRDLLVGGVSAATYGTNPPNATSPSTFIDGSMRLGGRIGSFVLTYNFSTNQGNFAGNMDLDEGPDIIYIPAGQRSGWTLGGLAGVPNNTVPNGYDHQVTGQCQILSVPTTHRTWGALKALYH
jgi:hypothetical protein